MNRTAAAALLALLIPGCVVYDSDVVTVPATTPGIVYTNAAPYVLDSAAYLSWDPYAFDDLVSFEAAVDDPNGVGDVIAVWADVYDDWAGGELVASVELYPTSDPYFWVTDVYNRDLWLDPYWDGYSVDFVVYDLYEDVGLMTVPLYGY